MLDAIKAEFENVSQEVSAYKNYKDDYEHKSELTDQRIYYVHFSSDRSVTSQIQEMQSVRQNVYELQMAHEKMKQM